MTNLLLIAPLTEQLQGGMVVWTHTFLKQCNASDICVNLLNIAAVGSRAEKANAKRNFADEFVRTKEIFKNLKQMLAQKEYRVTHMNTSCGAFGLIRDYLTVQTIKRTQPDCRVIVHFHCDVPFQAGSGYKRFFLKKLLSHADRAFALNEENRLYIEQNFFVPCAAVPNPVDEAWLRTEEKVISEDIKKAVFVGFVQPLKGIKEIYELAQKFPEITFDLLGEVRADVKKWEKPQNVFLRGKQDRLKTMKALDEADVFVFPTHTEGFSLALLESMARGLPAIATAVGANAEMLENRGGITVPVGDVRALENALETMRDPQKRKEMSRWNTEKVERSYVVREVLKRILLEYKKSR